MWMSAVLVKAGKPKAGEPILETGVGVGNEALHNTNGAWGVVKRGGAAEVKVGSAY